VLCGSGIGCRSKPPPFDPTDGGSSVSPNTLEGFEGEIGLMHKGTFGGVPTPPEGANVIVLVKQGRLRVPLPDLLPVVTALGMAYLIVEPEKKELYAVSDNQLMATHIDLDALLAYSQSKDATGAPPRPGAATELGPYKSGNTDTVAGYSCEKWAIQLGAASVDLCVAKLATPWLRVQLTGAASKHPWAVELTDGSHFPLRLITHVNGAEQGRLEVTSIRKTAVQTNSLQFPSNYRVVSLADLLASFKVHTGPPPSAR
jgi:hypothetical protein